LMSFTYCTAKKMLLATSTSIKRFDVKRVLSKIPDSRFIILLFAL